MRILIAYAWCTIGEANQRKWTHILTLTGDRLVFCRVSDKFLANILGFHTIVYDNTGMGDVECGCLVKTMRDYSHHINDSTGVRALSGFKNTRVLLILTKVHIRVRTNVSRTFFFIIFSSDFNYFPKQKRYFRGLRSKTRVTKTKFKFFFQLSNFF